VGPADGKGPDWWAAGANAKVNSSLYTQEFTFTLKGVKLKWENNGWIFTNSPGKTVLAGLGYTNAVNLPEENDWDEEYAPNPNGYTFQISEPTKRLILTGGAFLGHYAGVSTYEIITLTDDELYVKCKSTTEPGNGWWYRFVPKE